MLKPVEAAVEDVIFELSVKASVFAGCENTVQHFVDLDDQLIWASLRI